MSITRFGVSLEEDLLEALDAFVVENQFPNRSRAIGFLVEKNLVEKKWQCNNVVAGAVVLVYDHHKKEISSKLMDIQHDYHEVILSTQHFHLNHDVCLEIIAVKGASYLLTELSDKLISCKGIRHGKLVMSKAE